MQTARHNTRGAATTPAEGILYPPKANRGRCVILAVFVFCSCIPSATADQVDSFARAFIKRRAIPAAAVAVVKDGKIVKAAGYGTANLEAGVPATEHTLFEIGSITKQFTAEAVMMLVDEGKVGLTDPIGTYLQGIPPEWTPITVAHLLTHTSGLHDWESAGDLSYRREYTSSEYIALIASQSLDFTPGTRWSYTNSGFPLLGMIVEKASGTSYETFVSERIFKRAGMTDTRFKHPEDIVRARAAGYVDRTGVLQNGEPLRPRIIAPNGGILSSAIDMARWEIALAEGTLLPRDTLSQMTAPVRLSDGTAFSSTGTAWFIQTFRGHRMLLHNGSTIAGFSSVVYWYPDDRLMVVALANIDRWNAINVLATRVADFFVPLRKSPALNLGVKNSF